MIDKATPQLPTQSREWQYFTRALRLRCPECGESRVFARWKDTHTFNQWMHPLEGCPKCHYKYEREPGYFLLSTWALNYGLVGGTGLAIALAAEWLWHPPFWLTMSCVALPVIIANMLFVRHSKALFLAFDHFMDPQNQSIERQEIGVLPKFNSSQQLKPREVNSAESDKSL